MVDFIFDMPSLLLFLTLFLIGCVISASALYFVYRYVPFKLRQHENVASGYVVGSISVIYAVLAGFLILYAMNNFDKASVITVHEATVITKIFRDASRLPDPQKTEIQHSMENYARTLIDIEFPALAKDKKIDAGLLILDKLDHQLNTYTPTDGIISTRLHAIHTEIDDLYATYDQRMNISNSALTPDLWALFLISSVLTLIINCLLGVEIRLHVALQFILTVMVSATLFLIIAMDYPFSGTFAITPKIYQISLIEMEKYKKER